MGRKEEFRGEQNLSVKLPSFFRCPISLDVMTSPVSLCTGVTYDRSSIQRWLDSGNLTCPATNLALPSTDLVPNLTLQRLISLYRSSSASPAAAAPSLLHSRHLLDEIRSSADPLPSLRRLSAFLSDPSADDFDKNTLLSSPAAASALSPLLRLNEPTAVVEAAIAVLSSILTLDSIDESNKKTLISSLTSDLAAVASSLTSVLKSGSTVESRTNAANLLSAILASIPPSDAESKVLIAEKPDLIPELIRLIDGEELDRAAVEAGLAGLVGVSGVRKARIRMVRAGIIPVLTRVLTAPSEIAPASAAEKALKLMESAAGCADGRSEICNRAEETLTAVMGRMMKVGKEGTEAATVVIWSVCCLFRDRRAEEAVGKVNGGLGKVLMLMQSNCSAAVRGMAGDLIKIFRVNSKSCLSGYDTKTTHIMPF